MSRSANLQALIFLYTRAVESDHGAFNTPTKPTIGFLIKHPRPAINLWFRAKGLEMKDGVPQPKVLEPSKPQVTINEPLSKSAASIAPKKYVEMEFEPPALFLLDEWSELPAEARAYHVAHDLPYYVEERLRPYVAKYTAATGKAPPPEYQEPLDVDAILELLE